MRLLLVVAIFIVAKSVSYAQKAPVKFGDISNDELTMKIYDKDSSAVAVVLFDFGKAYVNINNVNTTLNFERHVRIKILKNEGTSWADVEIPLYHSTSSEEKVVNLKANTYNLEDGKVVESKMGKDGIFKEKFNRNINLQKFTLPNVKEGSIIEYSYTVMSDFLANFPNWQFQKNIPTIHSEYWAIIPEFFVMERYMQGYISPTVYEIKDQGQGSFSQKAHHWIIKDVPAFKEEPFMTTEDDYISKINFALAFIEFPGQPSREIMGSWEKLTKGLLEDEFFGKIVYGSGHLKKKVEELTTSVIDPLQKINIIHTYVKNSLEWNGSKDFTSDNLKDVFERKKGTSGDINLALASMLEKADIKVDMVLLSTKDHGFIRKSYPMTRQVNYVVCRVMVNDKFLFLDATDKFLPVGMLPERCINGEGLLVSKQNFGWIDLNPTAKAKSIVSVNLKFENENTLNGSLSFTRNGYDANAMRNKYKKLGHEEYLKGVATRGDWEISNTKFENIDSVYSDVKETHELTLENYATTSGDIIYLNPYLTAQLTENPFKLEERSYPIDFGSPQEKLYMCKITLPEGFVVDELPKSAMIGLPGNTGRFSYSVTQIGNSINIVSNFQINKSLFAQTEYPLLREFYTQVVSKQAEQIVLRRK